MFLLKLLANKLMRDNSSAYIVRKNNLEKCELKLKEKGI